MVTEKMYKQISSLQGSSFLTVRVTKQFQEKPRKLELKPEQVQSESPSKAQSMR